MQMNIWKKKELLNYLKDGGYLTTPNYNNMNLFPIVSLYLHQNMGL